MPPPSPLLKHALSAACLVDESEPAGTPCSDGFFCNGLETCDGFGICLPSTDPCPGQPCNETTDTCEPCQADADCDDGHVCTIDTCVELICENTFIPAGTVCRASTGPCDPVEVCDGLTASCPPDAFEAGMPCCDPTDTECDNPDTCVIKGRCSRNFLPFGRSCGDPGFRQCDLSDRCDGAGNCDPRFRPDGTPCDDADICTWSDAC